MTFEDACNLQPVADIAQDDHVVLEWEGSDFWKQIRPWRTKDDGQIANVAALGTDALNEARNRGTAAAPTFDVSVYFSEIAPRCCKVAKAPHLSAFEW